MKRFLRFLGRPSTCRDTAGYVAAPPIKAERSSSPSAYDDMDFEAANPTTGLVADAPRHPLGAGATLAGGLDPGAARGVSQGIGGLIVLPLAATVVAAPPDARLSDDGRIGGVCVIGVFVQLAVISLVRRPDRIGFALFATAAALSGCPSR